MSKRLKLSEIFLGSTDAKNEVLTNDQIEIDRFTQSYVTPPSLSISKFHGREKYYIVGLKGTGKTALLRYIAHKLDEDPTTVSKFVLFKSEVDEDLRKDFARAARVQVVAENSDTFDGDDFEPVWRWFIYRKIAEAIEFGGAKPFQNNANLAQFMETVNSEALTQPERNGLFNLIPYIKKGNVEISQSPKLGIELEWDNHGRAKINFNDLVRRADKLFLNLSPNGERLNLFFDELELNHSTSKLYQRDSRLVRDIIVTIEKINGICKTNGFDLCLYAAIRSEVLNSVEALGKEINKPLTDFGAEILWNRPGLDATDQPLLNIIERRINNSRKEHLLPALNSIELWKNYFPESIHGQNPQTYILHNSWYRPRDIVRLLLAAQDQYPDEYSFNVQTLEAIRKKYSTASWVEMTEELKAKYKAADIDGIKYIFYGFRQISSLAEISERATNVMADHQETKDLLSRTNVKQILKDLFRIGAIGNIDRSKVRFSFRGDDEILFEQNIFVHNALRAHLSITR
jgi:hypothetical protein